MENEIAISVKNLSKKFVIPHERINTLRGAFVSALKPKTYEEFKALDDISFEVKKGEFFGIIGRNGSGKSTLLKILAGIYQPDSGKVKVNGMVSPFLELGIGFNPELSGRDNIYLNATVLGLSKKQIDEKFDDIVEFSELGRFIDQKLKNYSSGMQVRLAFSVAVHANRDILLMDEVLAVGDANFQSKCLEEFSKYRDQGKTVILVTHDIGTVQKYCDRAMLLRDGKIEIIGDPQKVSDEYICQNMSHEEKRVLEEEKARKIKADKGLIRMVLEEKQKEKARKEEKKNKVAEIVEVKLLNKDREESNAFKTGDSMCVQIFFKVNERVTFVNFGIGLHSNSSGQIFGYNTQTDKVKISGKDKSIMMFIKKLPLLKGEYFINVSCFRNIGEVCYDFKPRCKEIKIYSTGLKNGYVGLLDIEHDWITDKD